jgi:hypothetical protein
MVVTFITSNYFVLRRQCDASAEISRNQGACLSPPWRFCATIRTELEARKLHAPNRMIYFCWKENCASQTNCIKTIVAQYSRLNAANQCRELCVFVCSCVFRNVSPQSWRSLNVTSWNRGDKSYKLPQNVYLKPQIELMANKQTNKQTTNSVAWVRERTIPTVACRLSAKLVPTFCW